MRPGYLVPVHDLEAGDGIRTDNEMAQFTIDFSDRIYAVMGIRPAIYINGNYAAFILGGASASLRNQIAQPATNPPTPISPAAPQLWSARWPNQTNVPSIDVQNGEPKDTYAAIYGPWDDYGVTHPWTFWQYASTGRLPSYNSGTANLDFDVVRGGVEFLKDQLVPAVWMHNNNGDWSTHQLEQRQNTRRTRHRARTSRTRRHSNLAHSASSRSGWHRHNLRPA
jgi:hypothetical protein